MQLREAYDSIMTTLARLASLSSLGVPKGRAIRFIIDEFRAAGARSRQSAQRFQARSDDEAWAFNYLMRLEIIRQPETGRYYLDEHMLAARNTTRFFE